MSHTVQNWRYRKSRSKYGNQSSTYNGYTYQSKKEAKFAQDLDLLVKAGEVERWERQVKIDLRVYGKHICNYFMDFVVYWKDGTVEYVEVKGFKKELWRLKWKMFEAIFDEEHPEIKKTIVM